jgi:hypothetical protein
VNSAPLKHEFPRGSKRSASQLGRAQTAGAASPPAIQTSDLAVISLSSARHAKAIAVRGLHGWHTESPPF